MKIRPVGAELFHADGQTEGRRTDMRKPIVAFRNLANAPQNYRGFGQSANAGAERNAVHVSWIFCVIHEGLFQVL
jgi:hypothetical protein